MIRLALTPLALTLLLALPVAAQPPAGRPGKVVIPPGAPPVISTTHRDPLYREPEVQLSRFVRFLQMGKRRQASYLFSSRVTPAERQAFLENRWLQRNPKSPDFTQVLFINDLQIRSRGFIQRDRLRLLVVPREIPYAGPKPKKKRVRPLIGSLEVPMRRERGRWLVELRQEKPFVGPR